MFDAHSRPDDQVVSEISQLLYKENVSSDILLSISSLIYTYCKLHPHYKENVVLIRDTEYMERKIKENMLIKENRDQVSSMMSTIVGNLSEENRMSISL